MTYRERFLDLPLWARIVSVVVLIALFVVGLMVFRSCTANDDSNIELDVAGRMIDPPEDPVPAVPDGVQNWVEFKKAADLLDTDDVEGNIMYDSLAMLHPEQGNIREAVAGMAMLEQSGKTFLYVAPMGATYINTEYRAIDGKLDFRFFEDETTNTVTPFLTFADDTVAVKAGCANAVRFHKTVPGIKANPVPTPSSEIPDTPDTPETPPPSTEVKGGDTTGGAARQPVNDSNAVVTPTTGYTGGGTGSTGSAETVTEEQLANAGDTANNGQVGHTGPAVDGTNSSGETNDGGGEAETTLPADVTTPATGDPGTPK